MAHSATLLLIVIMVVCRLAIDPAAALSLPSKAKAEEANNPAPATDDASRQHLLQSASSGADRLGTGNEGYTVTPQNPTSGVSVMSTESNTITGSTNTSTSSKSTNSETVSTTISVRWWKSCSACETPRKGICGRDDDWWECNKRGDLRPCKGGCRKCRDPSGIEADHSEVFTKGHYFGKRCCNGEATKRTKRDKCRCETDHGRDRQKEVEARHYCRVRV